MKTLEYYKTNLGLMLKNPADYYSKPEHIRINGIPVSTIMEGNTYNDWILLQGTDSITSYEQFTTGQNKHVGYELKVPTLASDDIPAKLFLEEVGEYYDGVYEEICWKNYNHLRSLYNNVYEKEPDEWKPVEFTTKLLREIHIDNLEKPVDMKVSFMQEGAYKTVAQTADLSSIVCYSDLEKMLTPEFLLHERPCSLTSEQVYKIVRHHIKNNIIGQYATITSDYDFCFTVKRKIAVKPFQVQKTVKNTPRPRPKLVTNTVQHKEVELFQMTHTGSNYQRYTPIAGWQANNLKEMAEQIKGYLDELMAEINRPVKECEHCAGTGHVGLDKIGTNDRRE